MALNTDLLDASLDKVTSSTNDIAMNEAGMDSLAIETMQVARAANDYLNRMAKYLSGEYSVEEDFVLSKDAESKTLPVFRAKDGIMYIASTVGIGGNYSNTSANTANGLVNAYKSQYFGEDENAGDNIKFPNKKYHGK